MPLGAAWGVLTGLWRGTHTHSSGVVLLNLLAPLVRRPRIGVPQQQELELCIASARINIGVHTHTRMLRRECCCIGRGCWNCPPAVRMCLGACSDHVVKLQRVLWLLAVWVCSSQSAAAPTCTSTCIQGCEGGSTLCVCIARVPGFARSLSPVCWEVGRNQLGGHMAPRCLGVPRVCRKALRVPQGADQNSADCLDCTSRRAAGCRPHLAAVAC